MMSDLMEQKGGWPDPARPGVPRNPERDGWHWLKTPDGLQVPYEWRAAGESERGRWPNYWVWVSDDNWQANKCTYLGPCLTHDKANAMQTRVAELEEVLRDLMMPQTPASFAGSMRRAREKLAQSSQRDEPFR